MHSIFYPEWVLNLQKCNLLQRYHAPYWLELAEAYSSLHALCTSSPTTNLNSGNRDSIFRNPNAIYSNNESSLDSVPCSASDDSADSDCVEGAVETEPKAINSNMQDIFRNTVTLFRPYFKWQPVDKDCPRLRDNTPLLTVSELLGRQVSMETFIENLHQLPWEQYHELLGLLLNISSCCCLIWTK